MDNSSKLAEQLQKNEITVLKILAKQKSLGVDAVSAAAKLKPVEVSRAAMYLENKGLVKQTKTKTKHIELDALGKKYTKIGLPEFKFLELVSKKPISLDQLKKHLADDEVKFSLGYWKKKGLILFDRGLVKTVPIAKPKTSSENELVKKLASGSLAYPNLAPKEKEAVKELGRRKSIIKITEKTAVALEITKLG